MKKYKTVMQIEKKQSKKWKPPLKTLLKPKECKFVSTIRKESGEYVIFAIESAITAHFLSFSDKVWNSILEKDSMKLDSILLFEIR